MARRRRFAPQVRRKMIWARRIGEGAEAGVSIPAAGVAFDLLAQFRNDGGSTLGSTVTRVRIDLSLDWAADFSNVDQLAMGVLVDQLQANQTEVPRPGIEEHADWMYWRRIGVSPLYSAIPLNAAAPTTAILTSWEIDVHSQRKMEELGQTLWFVLDPTFAGATTLFATFNSSVLLKLP